MHTLLLLATLAQAPVLADPPIEASSEAVPAWVRVAASDAAEFSERRAIGGDLATATYLDLGAVDGRFWSSDELEVLVRSSAMRGVVGLRLAGTPLEPVPAKAMGASRYLAEIEYLDLSNCSIGQTGSRALAFNRSFASVRYLNLSGNRIDSLGLKALLGARWADTVAHLALVDIGLPADLVGKAVLDSPRLMDLQTVELDASGLSEELEQKLKARFGEGLVLR
jgi:hypothetical protein